MITNIQISTLEASVLFADRETLENTDHYTLMRQSMIHSNIFKEVETISKHPAYVTLSSERYQPRVDYLVTPYTADARLAHWAILSTKLEVKPNNGFDVEPWKGFSSRYNCDVVLEAKDDRNIYILRVIFGEPVFHRWEHRGSNVAYFHDLLNNDYYTF